MLDCANENTPVRVSLVDRAQSTRFAFCDKINSNYLTLMMSKSIKADVKIADSEKTWLSFVHRTGGGRHPRSRGVRGAQCL